MNFEKPEYKITEYVEKNNYGKFEIEPLERGFGTTIGNALRRVMLSSMPGSAITSVKIDGVMHEFQKIDGVIEDVTTIVLNLKSVVIKNHTKENKTIRLSANKEGEVKAGDIELDADLEIMNPDLVICTLVKGGKIDMEMTVGNGRGYVDSKENKKLLGDSIQGLIPIDSLYSPIERVGYEVQPARVGRNENYDKLVMEVYTNGSMSPEEAMALAAKILIEHFKIVADLNNIADATGIIAEKKVDQIIKTLETPIEEIEFSVRAYNCLKRAGIHTMQDLIDKREVDVTKIRNLGKKSLKEVLDKVKEMALRVRDEKEVSKMLYRKLGRETRIRRSILAGLTKDVIKNEYVVTTDARAKEVRKFVDKMITYGKDGSLVSRRKALAFLQNDTVAVNKVFNELAKRYETRNGGYTRLVKLNERKGDDAMQIRIELV